MVDIRTLGTAAISLDGDRRIGLVGHPDAFALFVLLALEGPVERAELRRLVGGGSPYDVPPADPAAGPTLDRLLGTIDAAVGDGCVQEVEGRIRLAPYLDIRIDAARFDAALRQGDLPGAARVYGGSFLAGLPPPSSDGLRGWVEATRRRFAEAFTAVAEGAGPAGRGADDLSSVSATDLATLEDPPRSRMERFMDRVRGRLTYQVAAFYVVAAWAGLQVVDMLVDRNILGDFAFRTALVLAVVGMPIVVLFAWARDEQGVSIGDYPDTRGPWPRWVPRTRTGHTLVALAVAFVVLLTAFFVLRETIPRPAARFGAADPSKLAVLFFDDHSPGRDLSAEAAGFTGDLIGQLQAVPTLDVRSLSAVKPFRGGSVPQDSIFSRLDVGALVEGALTRAGDSLRVSVSLVAATDSGPRVLASQDLYGLAGSELALGADLAAEVARILREQLGVEIRLRELRRQTDSDDAWLLVQRAIEQREEARAVSQFEPVTAVSLLERADSLLALAEKRDPDWTEPIVQRGWTAERRALVETEYPGNYDEAWARVALDHANRALGKAPNDPSAAELRGTIEFGLAEIAPAAESDSLMRAATADLRVALAGDKPSSRAALTLSRISRRERRYEEAREYARRALEADYYVEAAPDILWQLYSVAHDLRDREDAEARCAEGRRRWKESPTFYLCPLLLLASYADDPADLQQAEDWIDALVSRSEGSSQPLVHRYGRMIMASVAARIGLPDSARALIRTARRPEPLAALAYDEAHAWVLLGEPDSALSRLEEYVEFRPTARESLPGDWWFEDLFELNRFRELTEQLGDR